MTVKLLLLKSGEDIVADVKELSVEDRTVGYLLTSPYIAKINSGDITSETQNSVSNQVSVTFYPYIPLSDQKEVPIPADWVITIVEPVRQVREMYEERISQKQKKEQGVNNDQITDTDEQSDTDQSD